MQIMVLLRRLTPKVLDSASETLTLCSEGSPATKDPRTFLIGKAQLRLRYKAYRPGNLSGGALSEILVQKPLGLDLLRINQFFHERESSESISS